MAAELLSFEDLYLIGKNEVISIAEELTDWTEGAINDAYIGSTALMVQEAYTYVTDQFRKTFLGSAEEEELDFLVEDHYGEEFARPEATKAVATLTFSRPTSGAGTGTIPAGSIVKTNPDANGTVKKFLTLTDVEITGLTINASAEAENAGVLGNTAAATIVVIESSLFDPTITVNNTTAASGGAERLSDEDYREYVYEKLLTLAGATLVAIEAAARSVAGITHATGITYIKKVIEWDESTATPIGDPFRIVDAVLYVADVNGTASAALITEVEEAIQGIIAAGVNVRVLSGVAVNLDWELDITLNSGGPNFAELSVDAQPIVDDMIEYVQNLDIGQDFVVATAEAAIMAIWGPSGSNDLTAVSTVVPVGNVSAADNEKLVPDTVEVS